MRDKVIEKADKHINHFVNLLGMAGADILRYAAKGFMGHKYREENVPENTLNDMSDEQKGSYAADLAQYNKIINP